MIYHKFKQGDRTTIINELYDDELYDDELITYCGGCQKEMEVTREDILDILAMESDFSSTTFYCKSCSDAS